MRVITRRDLTLSLALLPLSPGSGRAATDAPIAVSLAASAGLKPPAPPLRYGDASPGPVLRIKRDGPVRLSLLNGLDGPTSLDLHGLRVPPLFGATGPLGNPVAPGARAEATLTPPDSGTFWLHPWILDPAVDTTAQGLAGVLIVEEPAPPDVDSDLVAVITDRWPLTGPDEPRNRDALRIDGGTWPRTVSLRPRSRVRLRLVSASTRRAVAATLTGAVPSVVAIDGQPSELFRPLGDTVPVGPGARFDLMFDMPATAAQEARLLIGSGTPGAASDAALVFKAEGDTSAARGPIVRLPPNPLLPPAIPLEASTRASLVARRTGTAKPDEPARWTINGVSGVDPREKLLFRTKRGSAVTLAFKNMSPEVVAFRVHGVVMRLLHDLDDGWEPYWRDTVLVPPGVTHHAAFLADIAGRWLIESPFFPQAAGGLSCWFEVM